MPTPAIPLVYALAFGLDGSLYAGGHFTTAGGVDSQPHRSLGRRLRRGIPLGSGMSSTNGDVYALAIGPDGSLYAGGCFHDRRRRGSQLTSPAGTGTAWHSLGSGVDRTVARPGVWTGRLALHRGLLHHRRWRGSQLHRPLGRQRRGTPWAAG